MTTNLTPAPAAPPLRWGDDGLIPAVVQDHDSGDVLMVAFLNQEALAATRTTGRAHFWSRSRGKLWRKGETSGHEQIVTGIHVNCEQNSLLLTVHQVGAVCHDGYPTCFYRRLEPDDSLLVTRERSFDPAAVYGEQPSTSKTARLEEPFAAETRLLYGAFAYLRDHDLTAVSRTSSILHAANDPIPARVADELRELAGVLEGSHHHDSPADDALLEGTQCLYWLLLAALRVNISWQVLRPDRALATGDDALAAATVVRLLHAEADRWQPGVPAEADRAAVCHAALALVAQASRTVGPTGPELVAAELAELRTRPYLAPYFASLSEGEPNADTGSTGAVPAPVEIAPVDDPGQRT